MLTETNVVKSERSIENSFQMLHFSTIRPVTRGDVPTARHREKNSSMHNLEAVKDFVLLLNHVRTEIVKPEDVIAELDLSGEDIKTEQKKRKSFSSAFRALLKTCVKDFGLEKQIDVIEREHGTRFFVVGRAA